MGKHVSKEYNVPSFRVEKTKFSPGGNIFTHLVDYTTSS
jgi:hypothetical protein